MNAQELRVEGQKRAGILLLGVLLGGGFVRFISRPTAPDTPAVAPQPSGLRYEVKFKDPAKPAVFVVGTRYSWSLLGDCLVIYRDSFWRAVLVFDSCGVASVSGTEASR